MGDSGLQARYQKVLVKVLFSLEKSFSTDGFILLLRVIRLFSTHCLHLRSIDQHHIDNHLLT